MSIDNVNVFGGDSDCVVDVCQHFASNSGCVVKVQAGINVYVFFRKRMRGRTHAGGGLVRHSGSVQHGPGVDSSHTGKACALPKLQGHLLLIFLSSAVNFVKVSLARLETLTRLSE